MNSRITKMVQALIDNVEQVVFGKHEVVKLCVVGLLARGHLLIEDVPGIGKTTVAQSIAKSIRASFSRIQFTNDMLPSDILGVSVLEPKSNTFEFRKGPIFANVILADEVNRTPPKTQSALLEAMSEGQISADGKTHALPEPFIVIATQNPIEYEGTYTLPESQLDRFMLRLEMGYPPEEDELRIMKRHDPAHALRALQPVLTVDDLMVLQEQVSEVVVDESVARYMLDIVKGTRTHSQIQLGASPRGSLAFYEACQARALVEERDYVTPDDVRQMAVPVLAHRILSKSRGADLAAAARERANIVHQILQGVEIPV